MIKKYKIIFETYNPGDISLIKSLFDAEGVDYLIENENFAMIRPLSGVPMLVKVNEDQLETARDLLSDFEGGPFGQRKIS